MNNRKRELLESAHWPEGRPQILTVTEAFAERSSGQHFYMVAWWGDVPAGFSRFEFTGYVSGGVEIRFMSEGQESFDALETDELVLVFDAPE